MAKRIKRDRVRFTCPNCDTIAYARPSNRLVCGTCCLPMEPQIPASYPKAVETEKKPFTNVAPVELPLETLALPDHVRALIASLEGSGENTPKAPGHGQDLAVAQAAAPMVLSEPEQAAESSGAQAPKQQRGHSPEMLAKADEIIRTCLQKEANGQKVRGWKANLAKVMNRHGAWVTKRIQHVQAQGQAVAA